MSFAGGFASAPPLGYAPSSASPSTQVELAVKCSGRSFFKIILENSVLSSLFEKLRDARDKTLVCKNRKPKKIV
jgi:hypothetical protein